MSLPLKNESVDELLFQEESDSPQEAQRQENSWRVLVVDDEEDIIAVTRLVLSSFRYQDRGIEIIPAYSAAEALQLLRSEEDIAVAYIDVVMETDNAGLDLVRCIRDELKNQDTQIILRTGQPGYAPEMRIIVEYGINDYRLKTDLDKTKLISSLVTALRGYQNIQAAKVSERNRALAEANSRARSFFFAQVNQTFRAPLNSVLGFCQLLALANMADEEMDYVKIIEREVRGVLESISDAQEFAKMESGKYKIESTEFSLASLLNDLVNAKLSELKPGVAMALELDDKIPTVLIGDLFSVQYVMNSVLTNVVRLTEKGSLLIGANMLQRHKSRCTIELRVSDTSASIPERLVHWLAAPYENVDGAGFYNVRPEGIGLLTCKHLIELLGGSMKIETLEKNGTVIRLTLTLGCLPHGIE